MKTIAMSLAALAGTGCLAAAASAQAFKALQITSGDATLQLNGTVFTAPLGDAACVTGPGRTDHLYKLTWYYRTVGANSLFSDVTTPTVTNSGNRGTVAYANAGAGVAGTARFDATLNVELQDAATPDALVVDQRLVFTSSAANTATRTFQVFAVVDVDVSSTPNDNMTVLDAAAVRILQTDAATTIGTPAAATSDFVSCFGVAPSRYQIGNATAIRSVVNGSSGDLNTGVGTPSPTVGGQDVAVAYQWSLTLAPGQSRTLAVKYGYNLQALRADYTNNGAVDLLDIFAFLEGWFASDTKADFDGQSGVDLLDIFAFLDAWFAGV